MIYVLARFHLRPERLDGFVAGLPDTRRALAAAPGCIEVRVLRDASDPTRFVLVEAWRSREAHATHMEAIVRSGLWATISEQFVSPPELQITEEMP